MAYCVQCGNAVADTDQYCAKCGSQQSAAGSGSADLGAGISGRTASLLCYIPWAGWIAAIFVLATQRFQHESRVRFHAFQGLYLFAAWVLVGWTLEPAFPFRHGPNPLTLVHLVILAAWIFMLVKVSQGEDFHLPGLGTLAERSAQTTR